jgi:hypothetical protein
MWNRGEISVGSDDDQSHYLHPPPYRRKDAETAVCCGRRVIPAPSLRYGGGDGDDAVGGTTVQLVIESPWSQFTCECRRFGHPPRRND